VLRFIFPKAAYFHPSSLTDLKVTLANTVVALAGTGLKTMLVTSVAAVCAAALAPLIGPAEGASRALAGWALVAVTVLVAMANDLATYVNHRLGHEIPALWPFHKVHHSAEVLTPLTVHRKHPLYDLIGHVVTASIAGPVTGVIFAAFGTFDVATILGLNLVYAAFNAGGANLRHSHIWIAYPRWLSHILVSPAMHQIHHSIDAAHYNKNYGEIFALWDWAFGSIYVPRVREALIYGVSDEAGAKTQPHPGLRAAYLAPFVELRDLFSPREAKKSADGETRSVGARDAGETAREAA
jgi:sterol desaturase/sphingolipid hydroxylase (fatty acid hydroxylase superfamily)